MKKSEVTFHADRSTPRPAVNVKVYNLRNIALPSGEFGSMTWEWIDAQPDEVREDAYRFAIEDGWERLQEAARDIFGTQAVVYSEGRSFGWAVVYNAGCDSREAVESWDALALSKWVRFCAAARAETEDTGYRYVWNMGLRFEAAAEEQADALERDSMAGPATAREGSAEP